MKAMTNLHKDARGMTGLETAIILIAFVTVAAVFGYAVLSAGLFSAERSKETIYSGLQSAKSNLDISGSVIATSTDNATVKTVLVTVRNAIGGNPIDMAPCDGTAGASNKTVISLTTGTDFFPNIKWTKTQIGEGNGNDLLEVGEQFQVTIDLTDLGTGNTLSKPLDRNSLLSLQIKPAVGSTITVMRTLPPAIDPIMDLH
jgi:flagellin FlaB